MRKLISSGVIAAALFATALVFADDKACCGSGASHKNMTAMCEATFAKLDLNAEQKAKMEKLAANCEKSGCTKESMTQMEKGARTVLTKKQLAAWKSACAKPAQS